MLFQPPQALHDGKHPNTAKLYKHISTIRSKESLDTQLELFRSKNNGEWSDAQYYTDIITGNPQSPARNSEQDKATRKSNITMIRPEVFKWATQRDLVIVNKGTQDETCYTTAGAYVQGGKQQKTVRSPFGYKKTLQARAARIKERNSSEQKGAGEWVHPKTTEHRSSKGHGGKGKRNTRVSPQRPFALMMQTTPV